MEHTKKDVNLSEILRRVANAQEKSFEHKDRELGDLATKILGLVGGMQAKGIIEKIKAKDRELKEILEKYK